jgi:hypothetical protein
MVTSRIKKGREDKMKANEMMTRTGTNNDESRMAPLSFHTNNLKGTFDNYQVQQTARDFLNYSTAQ